MSGVYKAAAGLMMFISIRKLLDYLGVADYGLWVLIFTIFQWVLIMDFGVQSTLKTVLPVLILEKKFDLLKSYIKTTYRISFCIGLFLFLSFVIILYFNDFTKILNIDYHCRPFINKLFLLNVFYFCVNFIFNIHKSLNVAFLNGKCAEQSLAVNQFSFLILLSLLTNFSKHISLEDRLLFVTIANGTCALVVNLVYTYLFFKKQKIDLKTVAKTPKSFTISFLKLGVKYMIIELGILMIFSSDNYIISNAFSTNKVAVYEVVNKLFQFPFLILFAVLSPLWSMFAANYVQRNKTLLLQSFKQFNLLFVLVILAVAALSFLIPYIIPIWINQTIHYPNYLILFLSITILLRIYVTFYAFFINGIGQLNFYLLLIIISVCIKLPLSYFFVRLGFDINSVVLSSLFIMLLWVIFIPYRCYRIVNNIDVEKINA